MGKNVREPAADEFFDVRSARLMPCQAVPLVTFVAIVRPPRSHNALLLLFLPVWKRNQSCVMCIGLL
jgi:hypothetical protein